MRQINCGPALRTKYYSPFNSLINQFFSGEQETPSSPATCGALQPRTDIVELPEHFEVTLDLPGMEKKDINISIVDGILTVSGERKADRKIETDQYSRIERKLGEFQRSFRLPEEVETDTVNAEYKNGVLTLQMKKREEVLPKKIEVAIK